MSLTLLAGVKLVVLFSITMLDVLGVTLVNGHLYVDYTVDNRLILFLYHHLYANPNVFPVCVVASPALKLVLFSIISRI